VQRTNRNRTFQEKTSRGGRKGGKATSQIILEKKITALPRRARRETVAKGGVGEVPVLTKEEGEGWRRTPETKRSKMLEREKWGDRKENCKRKLLEWRNSRRTLPVRKRSGL